MAETRVEEIWFQGQRVIRTLVQTGIPSFITFAGVLPSIISALGLPVGSRLYVVLVAIAAGVTAVAGALSRVMAIPAVNTFLTKFGLGSVPKVAAKRAAVAASVAAAAPDVVTVEKPKVKALKAEWVAYAASLGDDVSGLTVKEIRAKYSA